MASLSREPKGSRRIQFVAADGKRRSLRLGKASQRTAESFPLHVVCNWIGNSQPVAMRHYLQIYRGALREGGAKSGAATARKGLQQAAIG